MIIPDSANITVCKNGEPLSGVLSVETADTSKTVNLYEFHRAEPYASVNCEKTFEITLRIYCGAFFNDESGFELSIASDFETVKYLDCSVRSLSMKKEDKGQIISEVKISSRKRDKICTNT